MGIRKAVKKQLGREAKRIKSGAKIVDRFIPGMGIVSNEVAKIYKGLSKTEKKKVHSAKGKNAKGRTIKKCK